MKNILYTPLSDDEIQKIQSAALRILEKTGLVVKHEIVLGLLKETGCDVDFNEMVVRFPLEIVNKYLDLIPLSFPLGKRNSADTFQMDPKVMFTRPQSGCPNVLALEDGEFRPATQVDAVSITRLIDGLEHVDFCASLLYPWDVPAEVRDIRVLQIMFNNSNKHAYIQPFNGRSTMYMIQMAEILRSSKGDLAVDPPLTIIVGGTSPLMYTTNELDVLIEIARVGVPVMIGSTPIAGATAPVTIAGQVLLQHVENLAGLVIMQVLRPGTPVTYAARPSYMDMRKANATWGNIEWGMATAAIAQLTRSQGFLLDVVGLPSDSKIPDVQAGIEKVANALLGGLSSPNVLAGVGAIETIRTGSFEQVVIDDEICGMVKRLREGIDFDEDRLAEELINEVGISGNYLTEAHTLKYFRSETYQPKIFDRQMRSYWKKRGSKIATHQASERARKILDEHQPLPLDERLSRELQHIYESAFAEIVEDSD